MSDFQWPLRIYYEDTDAGGIVYHSNYLKYLERARTEWLRGRGRVQSLLARDEGVLFSVVSITAKFLKPARLDDELLVSCRTTRVGGASVSFAQQIRLAAPTGAAGSLLLDAEVRVACIDARSLRPRRLPVAFIEDES